MRWGLGGVRLRTGLQVICGGGIGEVSWLRRDSLAQIGVSAAWSTESIVLSLGKLATGQARYYLYQAQGSLTRAQSVSSGVEDYYLEGSEADGAWMGAGTTALGLRGHV